MLRKLRPAPSPHDLPTEGESTPAPVALVGGGLASLAGSAATALLSMVATRQCGAIADPSFSVANGKSETMALLAPAPLNAHAEHRAERIWNLAATALEKTLSSLAPSVKRSDVQIYTILAPGQDTDLAGQELSERFQDHGLNKGQFHFLSSQDGSLHGLTQVCHQLQHDKGKTILFGGADSLIDPAVCMDLAEQQLLAGLGLPGGIIPGEAAAYLALQAAGPELAQTVVLKASAALASPTPIKHPSQLAQAIRQCLEQAAISSTDIDTIILPYGSEQSGALEWYHASQKIWPPLKPQASELEQLKSELLASGQQPKALYPTTTLGETGAALLPLTILLAQARFAFQYPPVSRTLVCQAGAEPWRGALILEQPVNTSKTQG